MKQTHWIDVKYPSGEHSLVAARQSTTLGRSPTCDVILRDPTLPLFAGRITFDTHERPWLHIDADAPAATLGDLQVRTVCLQPHLPIHWGECELRVSIHAKSARPHKAPTHPHNLRPWLAQSPEGIEFLWNIKKTASTPLAIYLAGETGTGKEVLAHLIHAWSDRVHGPFIPLHCGALPLSLAESELFGHVKGAFTGAVQQRPGALLQAHGGTLFLDEIGDLPLEIQVKLLRFLENGEIKPVGSDTSIRTDVRLICATHLELEKLVEEGKFRRDLFFRIASVTLKIPPLRSRLSDIEFLAKTFAGELSKNLTERALLKLKAHPWPGNVRELRHAVERAAGMAGPFVETLREENFHFLDTVTTVELNQTSAMRLSEAERFMLLRALRISHGHRAKAAQILGVARSTVFDMIKRHGIEGPRGHLH